MNTQISLMITTDEFSFTNAEVGFIKKNFQRKYPAVMGDFIDHVRSMMKAFQTTSHNKLVYNAMRYFPEDSQRYHISESLASQSADGQRVYVSIYPVEASKKALFGVKNKNPNTEQEVEQLISELSELLEYRDSADMRSQTHTGLSLAFVVEEIIKLVKACKQELVVQHCEVTFGDKPSLTLDLSHRASRSHYMQARIDFTKPQQ